VHAALSIDDTRSWMPLNPLIRHRVLVSPSGNRIGFEEKNFVVPKQMPFVFEQRLGAGTERSELL